ncbi:LuxR C-terminal-related transcriptional regulator [Cupriavidus sp. AU9028]|uniref:helix-turn-helix transcriptional regulator n=1 Tax=Cupriavidus sp. AU9028 TaxID=2871157 RepID=UPI001C96789E|nr:LuxR C-terminal-related transcriptional regulator [Cupriavidus sp. AU9028]MBY4897139.1 LuxR C-terminal-related transcriptional regulator [Cupriavidus sp. AU9028]
MVSQMTIADQLIGSIYDSVFAGGAWGDFLDALADAVPHAKASLLVCDRRAGDSVVVAASSSWKTGAVSSYNDYYGAVNPLPRLLLARDDRAYVDRQLIEPGEFHRSEVFNDFLHPNGMGASAGIKVELEDERAVLLGLAAPVGSADDEDIVALLDRLGPHLRRGFSYWRKSAASLQAGMSVDVFDSLDVGMMVVGAGGRVREMSPTMSEMLARESPVEASPLGSIRLSIDEAQSMLEAMLEDWSDSTAVPHMESFCWRDRQLTLVRLSKDRVLAGLEGPSVAVLLRAAAGGQASRFDGQELATRYGLTRAESRALHGIVAGLSIDQMAEEAYVSRETIRSQMKSLYAKTGTNSMTDILRLALLRDVSEAEVAVPGSA